MSMMHVSSRAAMSLEIEERRRKAQERKEGERV
jgi:hypothetical protein